MSVVNTRVYGGIRRKSIDHEAPVLLNSRVSLPEAVEIWITSLRACEREAKLARERAMRWHSD